MLHRVTLSALGETEVRVSRVGLGGFELGPGGGSAFERAQVHAACRASLRRLGRDVIDYLEDRDLVRSCGEPGIGVVIYEPVASGILTGRTMEEVKAIWTGPWVDSAFYRRLLAPGKAERSFGVADGIRPIAQRLDASVAQVAIAWVLAQPGVTAAIAGSRDGRQVEQRGGCPRPHRRQG
jgi:aryl-alcohol dehydrogenase-like predicted oxidoreductase